MKKSYSFCTDEALRINWSDEGFAELAGCPGEAMGRKYHEIFPRIKAGNRDAVRMAISGSMAITLKSFCLRSSSGQFFADVVIRPLKPGRKGWTGRKGARITIFPRAHCQLARQLHNYQPLIDIGKTASILAHGVRNPLNAIKGAVVYLGEKYREEAPLLEFTKLMEEEISRLDNFISRFLSAGVAEMGREVDVNSLVKKTEVFVSLQALANGIKSEFRYARRLPPVVVNPFQLEQAILNVVNNAIEAMAGGGRLAVRTVLESGTDAPAKSNGPQGNPPGGRCFVVICISDTGSGSAGSIKERPAVNKGKGFGLFLTREILRYWGGLLQIKSRKGAGTTVRLCIPSRGRGRPSAPGANPGRAGEQAGQRDPVTFLHSPDQKKMYLE
ncbi:MAG: ATP-binding protein [Nitrospiraceae bacterium]|nr:ATP-binding protein [Nitrospiraceae bacterium]